MLDSFFDSVCRVGIFMMCAQTIVHFKPKEVYDKYLRYLVSMMVLIQLFLPLGGFLLGGGSKEIKQALKQFEKELQESLARAEESAAEAEERLEAMTLEEVRRQMEMAEKNTTVENQEIKVETIEPITIGNQE